MTSLYGFQVLHGKIQDRRRMRQCTAGDVVYTDLGELSETILVHVAGSLEFRFALGHSNGLRGHLVGHVIEHDDICFGVERFLKHLQIFHFDLDLSYERRIGLGHLDCFLDGAGCSDVIVLDENAIGKILTMVRAAADPDCILFERTHIRSGLSGIEKFRIETFQFFCHGTGEGSDAAHALQEVECSSLATQNSAAVTGQNADQVALVDLIAIFEIGFERRVVTEHLKYARVHIQSAEDTVLLADQVYCDQEWFRHDGLSGHIVGSNVFAQSAHDIVVPKDRIKYTIVHRNLCPFS